VWCAAPNDWDAHAQPLLKQLYGPTWPGANSDGSRYVVLSLAVRPLTAEEEAVRPWLTPPDDASRHFFYRATAEGALEKVIATDLAPAGVDPVLEVLRRFSRKEVSQEHVVRALCEHEHWLAPIAMTGFSAPVRELSPDIDIPARRLLLFTDADQADKASRAGARLGKYHDGVAGVRVLSQLDSEQCERVDVNPYSPADQSFFFSSKAFDIVKLWAEAIATERLLRAFVAGMEVKLVAEKLRAFPGYLVFAAPEGPLVTLKGQAGLANAVVVFTAPDASEAFLARLPRLRDSLKRVTLNGEDLFSRLTAPTGDVDGAIFNPVGPGDPCVLSLARLRALQ